jgi:Zn-dependent protease
VELSSLVQTIAIYALPVLFAITLHEAAHGYVARHFGDMTAHAQGRISLNPIRHVDVAGTIVVPLLLITLSGGKFVFGWAKPVPVNYSSLREPKQHMAWVAAAGPAANLAMAIAWALLLKSVVELPRGYFSLPMSQMALAGIVVNLVIMTVNLLPILPLDGGRILAGLLPKRLAWQYGKTERWGGYVFLAFIAVSLVDSWLYDGRYVGSVFAPLEFAIDKLVRAIVAL